MQIVGPIDIEEAVSTALAASAPEGVSVTAYPPPDGISGITVSIQSLGSFEQSAVSDAYDLVAYAWAPTYSAAYKTAFWACTAIRALRFGSFTGVTFNTSEARAPYEDPDPERKTLKRCTVHATVGARGVGFIDHK